MLAHQALTREIIGAAIEVHKHIGPGFLETINVIFSEKAGNGGRLFYRHAQERVIIQVFIPVFLVS